MPIKSKTSFNLYALKVAQARGNEKRQQVLDIIAAATKEGHMPKVQHTVGADTWERYKALFPAELEAEAGRLWQTYRVFVRQEAAQREAERRHLETTKRRGYSTSSTSVSGRQASTSPKRTGERERWRWITQPT